MIEALSALSALHVARMDRDVVLMLCFPSTVNINKRSRLCDEENKYREEIKNSIMDFCLESLKTPEELVEALSARAPEIEKAKEKYRSFAKKKDINGPKIHQLLFGHCSWDPEFEVGGKKFTDLGKSTKKDDQLYYDLISICRKIIKSTAITRDDSKDNEEEEEEAELCSSHNFVLRIYVKLINYSTTMDICRLCGYCKYKDVANRHVFRYIIDSFDANSVARNAFSLGFAANDEAKFSKGGFENVFGEIKISKGVITGDYGQKTTDAIINGGKSGGPTIDDDLNLCGINVSGEVCEDTCTSEWQIAIAASRHFCSRLARWRESYPLEELELEEFTQRAQEKMTTFIKDYYKQVLKNKMKRQDQLNLESNN